MSHASPQRLGLEPGEELQDATQLEASIKRVRRGHELRLIVSGDGAPAAPPPRRDERLVSLIAESMQAGLRCLAHPNGRSTLPIDWNQQRIALDLA